MTAVTQNSPPESARRATGRARRRRWLRLGLLTALLLAGAGLTWEFCRVVVGSNRHVVIPGRVYRSAQLSEHDLERVIARDGIRTVINLRGNCFPERWYIGESRGTHQAGIGMEDVSLTASRYPSRTELKRLLEVLDHVDYPILLHCRRGADRTGLASTVVLLLQPDVPLARARRQLGPRFGHVPLMQTASLDAFFDLYETWLRRQDREHSPAAFREWALRHYRPGQCSCVFERCPRSLGPFPVGVPQAFAVRLRNDSNEVWHFRPTDNAGVHLAFEVQDETGQKVAAGKAGVFDRELGPGQSLDLTVALPGLPAPGTYRLFLDMLDEGQAWFYQMGSEPVECEVRVGE
jgi:protein tyrosine phosphatase (PTP) superfamily phosphohydrolase (DUF442 family)